MKAGVGIFAFIPTPAINYLKFGSLHLHYYALCVLVGILISLFVSVHLFKIYKFNQNLIYDLAIWVIPAGIIGARVYHVITSGSKYFSSTSSFLESFKFWQGGLGIWGAVTAGIGAIWLFFKFRIQRNQTLETPISFYLLLDLLTPGLAFAQAIGRWGNWFNGELFGKPSGVPWALKIPLDLRPPGYEKYLTFAPTFLYESLWCLGLGFLLFWLVKEPGKYSFSSGKVFWIYIFGYTLFRTFLETLRIDPGIMLGGMRLNFWVSGAICLISAKLLVKR